MVPMHEAPGPMEGFDLCVSGSGQVRLTNQTGQPGGWLFQSG
jgi:hypothetical protein